MALKKNTGYKSGGGYKKGGYQKKEFDPTVVSAKDVMMARMNAVTAVHTLAAAQIAAGDTDVTAESILNDIEEIFQQTLAVADHKRVGSANKTAAPAAETKSAPAKKSSVKKAEENIADAFDDDEEDAPEFEFDDLANLVLKGGKFAGNTLQDLYDDEDEGRPYLTEYLAEDKNKNDFTRVRARAFLRAVEAA